MVCFFDVFSRLNYAECMMMKQTTLLLFSIFISLQVQTQERITAEQYIERYHAIAVKKMQEFKIPASITLAQGILESGSGNSALARNANNHFGIKCHRGWEGKTYYTDDDEKNECFRAYSSPEESFHDHSLFLTLRPRYAGLFELDIMDYSAWAHGLSKAGYATNPRYPELLIRQIERYQLQRFDLMATQVIEQQLAIVKDDPEVLEDHRFIVINPSDFEVVGKSKSGRFIHENNRRKLIFARDGDQIQSLAAEFDIYSWQIVKYNEFSKKEKLQQGQMVYLEKKRRKSADHSTHVFREGESMHGVAQLYGIRLERLYKINQLEKGMRPSYGTTLKLK